jgi:hypothetical protein
MDLHGDEDYVIVVDESEAQHAPSRLASSARRLSADASNSQRFLHSLSCKLPACLPACLPVCLSACLVGNGLGNETALDSRTMQVDH